MESYQIHVAHNKMKVALHFIGSSSTFWRRYQIRPSIKGIIYAEITDNKQEYEPEIE